MHLNHPDTIPCLPTPWCVGKLCSTKLVFGTKRAGDCRSVVSFSIMHILNALMTEHQIHPNWGTFSKTTDQYSSQVSRSLKDWELTQTRKNKEIWQLNATWDSELGPGTKKKISEKNRWNPNEFYTLVNNIASRLIS